MTIVSMGGLKNGFGARAFRTATEFSKIKIFSIEKFILVLQAKNTKTYMLHC